MLYQFLSAHKSDLISLCEAKVASRRPFISAEPKLESGIPLFLDQLIATLEADGNNVGPEIGATAARHGRELLEHGYTIEQVVHDYGDLCQAVTELAIARSEPIGNDEFRTMNRCLDNGIAAAVTEFGTRRDSAFASSTKRASNERIGFLVHEMRNFIHTATLSVAALKSGYVGLAGATGAVLDRSLAGMSALIDRSIAEVRIVAALPVRRQVISLADFIIEAELGASLEAREKNCTLIAGLVDPALGVDVDAELLSGAVGNLLQNAFKFTHPHSPVYLNARASGERILIEVEDRCGGLPADFAASLFKPFSQGGEDREGLGLGLAICKRSVEDNGGGLSVRDVPGTGCVFTIDLPLHRLPKAAVVPASAA